MSAMFSSGCQLYFGEAPPASSEATLLERSRSVDAEALAEASQNQQATDAINLVLLATLHYTPVAAPN